VLLILAAVSIGLMLLGPPTAGEIRNKVHWVFTPLGDGGMYLVASFKSGAENYETITSEEAGDLRHGIDILHNENARLRDLLKKYEKGNKIVSDLFGPTADPPVRLIPARVIAADSMPYGWTRVINNGEYDGVTRGMYATKRIVTTDRLKKIIGEPTVLSGTVLAGRVEESGAFTARIRLVTDHKFEINVRVLRKIDPSNPRIIRIGAREVPLTPARAVTPAFFKATGAGAEGMIISDVAKSHNSRKGDVVLTRSTDGAISYTVRVGTVTDVEDIKEAPKHVNLKVRPFIDSASLRDVYIVIPQQAQLGEGK